MSLRLSSLGPLSYYRPSGPATFELVATTAPGTAEPVVTGGTEYLALRAAWDRRLAVVVEDQPLQAAAVVTSAEGRPLGVVHSVVAAERSASEAGESIKRAAELLSALLSQPAGRYDG